MKVLVTGAGGFVGQGLVARLRSEGAEVVPATRETTGDLLAFPDLRRVLAGATHVIHLAARVHQMREAPLDALARHRRMNVDVTMHVARAAATAGVTRLLYVSSVKALGEVGRFREDDLPRPSDPYGVSKLEAERALLALAGEGALEVTIVRPPLVYGPGVGANVAALMRAVDRGWPLPFGATTNRRSLVARANLADLIAVALKHPRAANGVFHVSDGEDLSTAALVRRLAAALGRPARLVAVPVPLLRAALRVAGRGALATRLLDSLELDISKARELLAWRPPVRVDDAMREMAAAWRA